jgi:hypothetical protein
MEISEATRLELVNLLQHLGAKIGVSDGGKDDLVREAERHIQAIRDSVKRIVQCGKNDVFASYLLDQLESLATVCIDASTKGVLRVTEHQFGTAQLLMNAFGDKKLFRYIWRMLPGQRLFEDVAWRKHFELTSSLAISGAIEIRTLLIMPDLRACEAANIEQVLGFFATQENMSAKIVTNANWDACVVDHGISADCIEFGIYGANLLYEASAYAPVSLGSWSKNAVEIERYTRFFEAIWKSQTVAIDNPVAAQQKVRMSQVMAVDSALERRHGSAQSPVHDSLVRIEERIAADAA